MKPSESDFDFEAKFTAWLDSQLEASQIPAFEEEMRANGFDPALERAAHQATCNLLRGHVEAPLLGNPDFFQHQLLHRIEQSENEGKPARASMAPASGSWFTFPRMLWGAAASLAVAAALFKGFIPTSGAADQSPYFATIVDARVYDPNVSVDTVYNSRDNVTVVWLDGLDYVPDIVQ